MQIILRYSMILISFLIFVSWDNVLFAQRELKEPTISRQVLTNTGKIKVEVLEPLVGKNLRGVDYVYVSFRPGRTFLGWSPEEIAQFHPELVSSLWQLRHNPVFESLWWHHTAAFGVGVYGPSCPERHFNKNSCQARGSVSSRGNSREITVKLKFNNTPIRFSLKTHSDYFHEIPGEPKSTTFSKTVLANGKREKPLFEKGVVSFLFHNRTSYDCSLTNLKTNQPIYRSKWVADGSCKGTITLARSATSNWVFAEVAYNGHKEGPGWHHVSDSKYNRRVLYDPQHTLMMEEFMMEWGRWNSP